MTEFRQLSETRGHCSAMPHMHCKVCLISGGFGVLLLPRTLNHAGKVSLAVRKERAAGQVTSGELERRESLKTALADLTLVGGVACRILNRIDR